MPIIFIHGVNTRRSVAYYKQMGVREQMFDQVVVRPLRQKFPEFDQAPEVYWGDQGAKYHWELRSVPGTKILESLGSNDAEKASDEIVRHADLLNFLWEVDVKNTSADSGLESLGTNMEQLLAAAAQADSPRTAKAILAEEHYELINEVFLDDASILADLNGEQAKDAKKEGERLANLMLATIETQNDIDMINKLGQASTDEEALSIVHAAIGANFNARNSSPELEGLGVGDWVKDKLESTGQGIRRVVKLARRPKDTMLRVASLAALSRFRDPAIEKTKFFLGDVCEYAVRGREDQTALSAGVEQDLNRAAKRRSDENPFVVVTHSFGSAIFYDLITTGRFTDEVDLWVSVGAQVSFLAEMRFFKASPRPEVMPAGDPENNRLSKPDSIMKWVNVYDPADVLSFINEPIFDGVTDFEMRDGAHVKNAHGAYFGSKDFYRVIHDALVR